MFDIKKFGAYISRLRKKADMTQSELAERLNLTRQAISKYECGDSFPDISILIEVAEVFGITLDELISSGHPTEKEAAILGSAVEGQDLCSELEKQSISDIVNIAPLLVHTPGYSAEISTHPELVSLGYNVLHISPLGYATPNGPDETQKRDNTWPVLADTISSHGEKGYKQ